MLQLNQLHGLTISKIGQKQAVVVNTFIAITRFVHTPTAILCADLVPLATFLISRGRSILKNICHTF